MKRFHDLNNASKCIIPIFTWMIRKNMNDKFVRSVFHNLDHRVIQRILVLLEPSCHIVGNGSSVMHDSEMRIFICFRYRFHKVALFSQMIRFQFIFKRLVGCLGKQGLFFQNGQYPHRLFEQINTILKVHSEILHCPIDSLFQVLLLLQHKGVVIEKLLEFLVAEVDA